MKINKRHKKIIQNLITVMLILASIQLFADAKKVIYETDMCADVDDVGALSIIHALMNQGDCELLAVCYNEVHQSGPSAIDAINTWYGRGDIPIGIYRSNLKNPDGSSYLEHVAKLPHDLENSDTPSALDVYKETLSSQPDSSVTIISVGFLNNLYDLLKAEPDLVARKVNELVIMGGEWNDGFNLVRHNTVDQAEYVISNWPSPLVISQAGGSIYTGTILESAPKENPVRELYYRYFGQNFQGRPSWDQMTALYGVLGLSTNFNKKYSGSCQLPNGYTWQLDRNFRFALYNKYGDATYEHKIEQLMAQYPLGARFSVSSNFGWLPLTVDFDASSTVIEGHQDDLEYLWDFGDETTGEGVQVSHTYTTTDTFNVKLTVVDEQGDSLFNYDQIISDDPNFSPIEYFGSMENYDFNQISLWSTISDENDMKMYISDEQRDPNISVPGICFIKDSIYTDFSLNFNVKTGENLSSEPLADYKIIFGYVDDQNYKYVIMKETTSRLVNVKNGVGVSLIWTQMDGIPDEEYHTIDLTYHNEEFKMLLDDEEFLVSNSEKLMVAGKVGLGSTKYAAFFDNIDVKRLEPSELSIGQVEQNPEKFHLFNNYPNPFNPETKIRFELAKTRFVELCIYDIKGNKIRTIIHGDKSKGVHDTVWDGKNSDGLNVPSGIYFAKLNSEDLVQTIKLNLIR